jgi:hypothetical protein
MPHALRLQLGVPFATAHALPQNPQFAGELVRSVSQLTAGLLSHSPRPGPHGDGWHEPKTQISVLELQTFVHEPQCVGSSSLSVSQPLSRFPSQSA